MKNLRKLASLLLIIVLLFSIACPSLAATSVTLKTRIGCRVRSGPGTKYKVIGHLSDGKTVKGVLGKGESGAMWLKISNHKFGGKVGYVSAYCLRKGGSSSFKVKVTKTCFIRTAPDKNASPVGRASKGHTYNAYAYNSGWVKIGKGWIYSGCCKKL